MQVLTRLAITIGQVASFIGRSNGATASLLRYFDRLKICHMMNRVNPT